MDKLELFNAVARVAKPLHLSFEALKSLETKFKDAGIDSLDTLLITVYFCTLYGIGEEKAKEFLPSSPQEIFDFWKSIRLENLAALKKRWVKYNENLFNS